MRSKLLYVSIFTLFVTVFLVFTIVSKLSAQVPNEPVPLMHHYDRNDYNAGRQNWQIAQDSRGFMYFANNTGVLMFDGTFWKNIPVNNLSVVRSLYIDADDKIYVGAANEIGYLTGNSKGEYRYTSLNQKIAKNDRNYSEVWKILSTDKGIFFMSFSHVFLYRDGEIETLIRDEPLFFGFQNDNTVYVQHEKKGLLRYENRKFIPVANPYSAPVGSIWTLLPYSGDTLLLGTEKDGLFFLHNDSIKPFNAPANDFFIDNQIFSACKLQEDLYAFGTIQNGLAIVNREGRIVQHINKQNGLQNNTVLSLFSDKNQTLWLGLDNGISGIEINSPISVYSEGSAIYGAGYAALDTERYSYFGTNQGLFVKDKRSQIPIRIIVGTEGQVWNLQQFGNIILCSHNKGVFIISGTEARPLNTKTGNWTFLPLQKQPDKLLAGGYEGLTLYKISNNRIQVVKEIEGFNESSRTLYQDIDGKIWIGHGYKGIFGIDLNANNDSLIAYKLYNTDHGLPSEFGNDLLVFRDSWAVSTSKGLYHYNYQTDRFEKGYKYSDLLMHMPARKVLEDNNNRIWVFHSKGLSYIEKRKDIKNRPVINPIYDFNDKLISAFENITLTQKGNLLIGYDDGFLHYNSFIRPDTAQDYQVFVRKVSVNRLNKDSVVYIGDSPNDYRGKNTFLHKHNAVKFSVSVPMYKGNQSIKYRFKLKGLQKTWSQWQSYPQKEYTNIPSGKYSFMVQTLFPSGKIGKPASFEFEIKPAWYAGKTALAVYIPSALLLLLLAARLISKKIYKERKLLMEEQKKELQRQEEKYRHEQLKQEQEIIRLRNEKLRHQIAEQKQEAEVRNMELSSIAIQITHKNEILAGLKKKISKLSENVNRDTRRELRKINRLIEDDIRLDDDWKRFKTHFELVHEGFFNRLQSQHENLTPKDMKLSAYLRMNLSSKEIAPLMNISVRSVENSRYRLRKKMGLDKDTNLTEHILKL